MEFWFESPRGIKHDSIQFDRGQRIWVCGKPTGLFGPITVNITIVDGFPAMMTSTGTSLEGTFWWDVTLPDMDTKATVTAVAKGWLGTDVAQVEIGIGTEEPENPPGSEPPLGPADWTKYLIFGGAIIGAALVAASFIRRKKS